MSAEPPVLVQVVTPPPPSAARVWVRRLAPWLVAGLAIAALLSRYSPAQILAEIERGDFARMAPIPAVAMLVTLLFASFADSLIIRAALGPIRWVDVLRAKAAVTLLLVVQFVAAQGGYGVWLARTTGATPGRAAGLVLFLVSSELTTVCLVAALATASGGSAVGSLGLVAAVIAVVLLTLMVVGPLAALHRLPSFLAPWRDVPTRVAFAQIAIRLCQISFMVVVAWASANAFGIPVPLSAMATVFPVILVVGSLPVNVGGVGAVQGAWLLLTPWARSGEQVIAFSVLFQLALMVGILARGLPFLRRVITEIDEGKAGLQSSEPLRTSEATLK